MAVSFPFTTSGFEPYKKIGGGDMYTVKGMLAPNTAIVKGDLLQYDVNRKLVVATQGDDEIAGVAAESITAAVNGAATETLIEYYNDPYIVYRCSFDAGKDVTASGGTTTTLVSAGLTEGVDDYWVGALMYIYEGTNGISPGSTGPSIGDSVRLITGFAEGTDTLTFIKPLAAAPTATTKAILLGPGNSATLGGIGPGAIGVDIADANTIDSDGTLASEDGALKVYGDYNDCVEGIVNGWLPVTIRHHVLQRKDV